MRAPRLGCIADDFTGATDLANNLVRAGMRVVQTIGVPPGPLDAEVDAVVVALKSRTVPSGDAVSASVAALRWLQEQGAEQFYFKYCSTFDSTSDGNIGPVIDALMTELSPRPGSDFTIATPAFPDNKRAVFKGYLFVGDVLLNESGMQDHPLTPMRDANLVRVLQSQCRRKVGLVDYVTVSQGPEAIRRRFDDLRRQGVGVAIVDAISNEDLLRLGPAIADLPLVTAGSGVAIALPLNLGFAPSGAAGELPPKSGHRAVVAGSCSQATNRQVRAFVETGGEAFMVDALRVATGQDAVSEALAWASTRIAGEPVLIYSTADPLKVQAVQRELGVEKAGAMLEATLAAIARGLVALGVRQLVVAGGETAGACVQALDVAHLKIGAQIDPGVPWCYAQTRSGPGLHLALKSGNFGSDDFFRKSFDVLG
jgi:uncharacterized protein YgbK (DUF1537 family)